MGAYCSVLDSFRCWFVENLSNAHWTSDVIGGAAIGFLSAQAMNKLYNIAGKKVTFLPDVGGGYFGATIVYNLP